MSNELQEVRFTYSQKELNKMTEGVTLKTCPFCGSSASLNDDASYMPQVWCNGCGATLLIPDGAAACYEEAVEEVVRQWNNRI